MDGSLLHYCQVLPHTVSDSRGSMAPPRDGSKIYPTDAEWAHFENLIQKNAGRTGQCWIMEFTHGGRYPYFMFRGKPMLAARFAYRASESEPEIPPERPMLGRWCNEKKCVNPDHQFPNDDWRNNERTINPIGANIRKEVCPKCLGAYVLYKDGRRRCPECYAQSRREQELRRRVPCQSCGGPSTSGECRACRNARASAVAKPHREAKRAIRAARQVLRQAVRKLCEKHNLLKAQKPSGGWVCRECNRDTRKRVRSFGPDRYKALRAAGKCVTCHHPSETYRCERCHARHMEATHARRAREKAARMGGESAPPL